MSADRMNADRMYVSFEPELGDAVRGSARRAGIDVSQWLAAAAAAQLRAEALADFRDEWDLGQPSSAAFATAVARAEVGLDAGPDVDLAGVSRGGPQPGSLS